MPRSIQEQVDTAREQIDGVCTLRGWILLLREELEAYETERIERTHREAMILLRQRYPQDSVHMGRSDVRDAEFNRGR